MFGDFCSKLHDPLVVAGILNISKISEKHSEKQDNVWGFLEFHKLGILQFRQIVVSPVRSPPKCTVCYSKGCWTSFILSAGID